MYDQARYYKAQCAQLKEKKTLTYKDFETYLSTIPDLSKQVIVCLLSQVKRAIASKDNKRPFYSWEEKDFALNLYYSIARAGYLSMQSNLQFFLPSVRTITGWMEDVKFDCGINEGLFNFLSDFVKDLPDNDRSCVLTWDEMTIKKFLIFSKHQDEFVGIHDHGKTENGERDRKFKLANHALVFMVRSIRSNWVFPVSYYFSASATKTNDLYEIIKNNITKLQQSGLRVRVCVCDQGPANEGVYKKMCVTPRNPYYVINEQKIYMIHDTCHIIKNVRTALINHKGIISVWRKRQITAKWEHIESLYKWDSKTTNRLVPKLTHAHVYPVDTEKMRVYLATQVLSHTVSKMLKYCVKNFPEEIDSSGEETAIFVGMIDSLFDMFNCSQSYCGEKSAKCGGLVIELAEQLPEISEWIVSWSCLDKGKRPDCFKGFQLTVNGMFQLLEELKFEDYNFVLTRRIQQDCLEHFFSFIRYRCGNSRNPTTKQFVENFKYLFIIRNLKILGGNCKEFEEQRGLMDSFEKLANIQREEGVIVDSENAEIIDDSTFSFDYLDAEQNNSNLFSAFLKEKPDEKDENVAVYMGGWSVKSVLKRKSCEKCESSLLESLNDRAESAENSNETSGYHYTEEVIFWKAYNSEILKIDRPLCYSHLLKASTRDAFMEMMKNFRHAVNSSLNSDCTSVISRIIYYLSVNPIIRAWLNEEVQEEECKLHRQSMLRLYLLAKVFFLVKCVNKVIEPVKSNSTPVGSLRFK